VIQECEFELVVSDGDMFSEPDTINVKVVPDTGDASLLFSGIPFDPDKPTVFHFGGGVNCTYGGGGIEQYGWPEKVNYISTKRYSPPYKRWGDKLIVYLSGVAPNYNQPIQTLGFSAGGRPAIDVANRLNLFYADPRYAVNRVILLDVACRDYTTSINTFLDNPVDNEQCWIENHIATLGSSYPRVLNVYHPDSEHIIPFVRYIVELDSWLEHDIYNGGISCGSFWSVAGPGKNLQLANNGTYYYFDWLSDPDGGMNAEFHNEFLYPGRLPEPVTLIGPADGNIIDANGVLLTCQESENAVRYQLLFGSGPHRVMDYDIISDTPVPPNEIVTELPFEETWWTVRVYDQYGSTIYADPRSIRMNTQPVADAGPDQTVYVGIDGIGQVELDGAGSIDADGHELQYFWYIGDELIATGINVTVELEVGRYIIELIVDDGLEESEPDEVVVNIVGPMELLDILGQNIIDLELQQGIKNSLHVKLDTSLQQLEDDNENNDEAAINLLQAFINTVEAQCGKKIPQEDADSLIAAAQQIINILSSE
jgi:hypothetical protein